MQKKVYDFVESVVMEKILRGQGLRQLKVLDIGSFDVNGTLKPIFEGWASYTGLDMREGPNVDIVANSHDIPFDDNMFDIVTCVEMLEHDSNPFKTLQEIYRILRPGGLTILAASGINFPKHDYPSDYFRYTGEGIQALMVGFSDTYGTDDENEAYGYGTKL